MPDTAHRTRSLFVDAVEIPACLEADRATPYAERLHRDRQLAASAPRDPVRRVRTWWRAQASNDPQATSVPGAGEQLDRGRQLIGFGTVLVGALIGSGVASAAFHYDGTWPVNVVTVVAALVLVQVALVLVALLLMLPHVPGLGMLQNVMSTLNPGTIVAAIYRRFSRLDECRSDLLVFSAARGPAALRFARWQMLVWSQTAAIAFNLAALMTAAVLIAFTDLAFGWSTTLRLDSNDALRIVNALTLPWAGWWPDAVPSQSLIESSRFFRLASAPPAGITAEALTGWWPFLLAAIVTYGLLPRLALLMVALLRLRAATVHLLLDDPQVKALLDRMSAAELELGADDVEATLKGAGRPVAGAPADAPSQALGIVWSQAIAEDELGTWSLQHLHKQVIRKFDAGGGRALQADADTVHAVASSRPRAVLVLVRAWEAPLLDLQDFIESLRAGVGPACSIIVVPVGPDGATASASQKATWSRWAGRIADAALYVETGT